MNAEITRKTELLQASLFAPSTQGNKDVASFKKIHPFVVDVWAFPTGNLIIFSSPQSAAKGLAHISSSNNKVKFVKAIEAKGLIELRKCYQMFLILLI